VIDWHNHVLPGMDDGSKDVEQSLAMLEMQALQGVETVVATPHFYANDESVENFLARRQAAHSLLLENVSGSEYPTVHCGAEVKYYPGIARMDELDLLTVEGTKILLLEMSMSKWTEYTVKELTDLVHMRGLTVILAHVERYLPAQDRGMLERLREEGLWMQANAEFFGKLGSRRRALRLLDAGLIQFIGSDCHNLSSRPPKLDSAYHLIAKKFGEEYLSQMNKFGYRTLGLSTVDADLQLQT
jgi:protein-tyrosine phosphatase